MINLHERFAFVTAGSRGLGAEIVRQLARQGADVAFTYLKNNEAAEELKNDVQDLGRRCITVQADVKDYQKALQVVAEVQKDFGRIDIMVCNAGFARGVAICRMDENDWDDVINVSLKGAFNYIRAVAPFYMEQKYGKIVCIGSINGLRGRIGSASYNAAKAGLVGLVKTTAAELGRFNININLVAPGFIETPSQAHTSELIRDIVLKECAIKRLGTPEDIAPLVVFLCSEEAKHITGQVIKIDAGQYL